MTSMSCSVSIFLSDDSKQDAATPTSNTKRLILLLKEKKIITT